jgi:serine/threonine-protein kinase
MELLEGCTLAQELDRRGVLPVQETLAIMLPIVRALEAAHALGVVHRDVKPSNIFLSRDATGRIAPKLIDFGIAKGPRDAFDTETGVLLGTPGYMAPEQVQYAECSVSSDIWAIGAVLYRCLAGHPPHADTPGELLQKLVREPVPRLSAPGVGRQLCATIERALARDPHRRYASMQALGSALLEFASTGDCADTAAERGLPARKAVSTAQRNVARVSLAVLCFGTVLGLSAFTAAGAGDVVRTRGVHEPAAQREPIVPPPVTLARANGAEVATRDSVRAIKAVQEPPRPPVARPRRASGGRNAARAAAALPSRTAAPSAPAHAAVERESTTGLPVAIEW